MGTAACPENLGPPGDGAGAENLPGSLKSAWAGVVWKGASAPVCLFCWHLPWFLHCPGMKSSAGACPPCATRQIRPPEKDPFSHVLVGVNYSSPSSPEKRNKAQPVAHVIAPGRRGVCLRHKPSSLWRQADYKLMEPAALCEQTGTALTPRLMGAPRHCLGAKPHSLCASGFLH